MADFRTVFTDDDGDGFYDDVHVVNVLDNDHYHPGHTNSESRRTYNYSSTGSSGSVFSSRTKLKIALISLGVLFGASLIIKLGIFILYLLH